MCRRGSAPAELESSWYTDFFGSAEPAPPQEEPRPHHHQTRAKTAMMMHHHRTRAETAAPARHSARSQSGGVKSPESSALLSAWEDTAPVSFPPPAFLEAEDDPEDDSERRDDDRGPRDSFGRGGASFRGPKRPDSAARAAWRARQWTGAYDELDVVRWIPSVTLEHHAELARAVVAYVHRYGASRFLRIVDRAGRSPVWNPNRFKIPST